MKQAIVRFEWDASVSPDVVEQRVSVDGSGFVVIPATVKQYDVTVNEKSSVNVAVSAWDGTFESDPAVLDFNVGDLVKPQPPTGLSASVIDVVEVPEVA